MANCRLTSDCFMIKSKEKKRFSTFRLLGNSFAREKRSNSESDSFSSDSSLGVSNSLESINELDDSDEIQVIKRKSSKLV